MPAGEGLAAAIAFARELAVPDPILMRTTKVALNRTYDIMGMREVLQAAREWRDGRFK